MSLRQHQSFIPRCYDSLSIRLPPDKRNKASAVYLMILQLARQPTRKMVIITANHCESCGNDIGSLPSVKTLEDSFMVDEMKKLGICQECFEKRFKITTKKSSGYGGTIYELKAKAAPRFGLGSSKFSCLKCEWVAWTEEGLLVHIQKRHS